jgi:hypothetical protein
MTKVYLELVVGVATRIDDDEEPWNENTCHML